MGLTSYRLPWAGFDTLRHRFPKVALGCADDGFKSSP